MSCLSIGERPQPEEHLVSSVAVRAVLVGDFEGFESDGRDQLQPHGSREQTHEVTVVDDLGGSAFVSQEVRHIGHIHVGF